MLIMPSVRIPARDWTRLMQLAFDSDSAGEPCAPFFRNEVHRAIVLDDGECPHDIVCLNAGAALYAADVTGSISAGIELARATIASGAAHAKMQAFVSTTQRLAARGGKSPRGA